MQIPPPLLRAGFRRGAASLVLFVLLASLSLRSHASHAASRRFPRS